MPLWNLSSSCPPCILTGAFKTDLIFIRLKTNRHRRPIEDSFNSVGWHFISFTTRQPFNAHSVKRNLPGKIIWNVTISKSIRSRWRTIRTLRNRNAFTEIARSYHKSKMLKHMEEEHQVQSTSSHHHFDSEKEFLDWKEKEEMSNSVIDQVYVLRLPAWWIRTATSF